MIPLRVQYNVQNNTIYYNINLDDLPEKVRFSLISVFTKLEGFVDIYSEWIFPDYIFPQAIETIIKNTCFKCGGSMKPSKSFLNEMVSFDDFGNDAGERGTTQSPVGEPKLINVNKCSCCGHSYKL